MNSDSISITFIGLYLLVWVIAVIDQITFHRYFKRRHPELHRQIAPPLLERSIASGLGETKYIFNRGYATVDDAHFVKRCDLHRTILMICVVLLAAGLIVGFFLIDAYQ